MAGARRWGARSASERREEERKTVGGERVEATRVVVRVFESAEPRGEEVGEELRGRDFRRRELRLGVVEDQRGGGVLRGNRVAPRRGAGCRLFLRDGGGARDEAARLRLRRLLGADELRREGRQKGGGLLVDALVDHVDLRRLQHQRAERANRGAREEEVAVQVREDRLLGSARSAGRGRGALVEVPVDVGAEVAVEIAGVAACA